MSWPADLTNSVMMTSSSEMTKASIAPGEDAGREERQRDAPEGLERGWRRGRAAASSSVAVHALEAGADRQVGEGDAEGGMGEDQVAQALVARGRAHEPEDDEERDGRHDLGHHRAAG